jgi:hypothetical protein
VEERLAWDDLPEPLKQAIEARTGPIKSVRIATAGQNSPLAVIIDTAGSRVFAKGLPSGHRRVITQAREAAVAPLVREISPSLLWHFDEAGWNVLGYEYAPGRHADYRFFAGLGHATPESRIICLMGQIGHNVTDGATRAQARRQRSVRRGRGRAGALAALGALRPAVSPGTRRRRHAGAARDHDRGPGGGI